MKRLSAILLFLAAPLVLMAHPGHPGHDFGWDFSPIIGAVGLFGLVVAGVAWMRHRRQRS